MGVDSYDRWYTAAWVGHCANKFGSIAQIVFHILNTQVVIQSYIASPPFKLLTTGKLDYDVNIIIDPFSN